METHCTTARHLAAFYALSFGGKASGRYRISAKLVASLAGRRRLYDDDVRALTRALYEEGFVFVDMETYFVILSARTFTNYRRANADIIETLAEGGTGRGVRTLE